MHHIEGSFFFTKNENSLGLGIKNWRIQLTKLGGGLRNENVRKVLDGNFKSFSLSIFYIFLHYSSKGFSVIRV